MTTVPIIARVPADLAEAFALLAKSRGKDVSTELRHAMRERLEGALTDHERRPARGGDVETTRPVQEAERVEP